MFGSIDTSLVSFKNVFGFPVTTFLGSLLGSMLPRVWVPCYRGNVNEFAIVE